MILQRLKIENYKRLRAVDITFPEIGIFGIVGTNGAGKSTLFEAILWVLFRPNVISIDNRDVVPRRSVGVTTKVELTVETSDAVYTIMRSLRITSGGSQRTEASVYRGDELEPIVTGANPVSDYVRATLLRMTPSSFTTTFFTKQKELGFFSAMGETDRRREMQRLLDLDAVERAQAKLREQRLRERHALDTRNSQLTEEVASRDLDTEIADAHAHYETQEHDVTTHARKLEALTAEYEAAERARDEYRALQRRHETLDAEIRSAEQAAHAARATAEDARQRIARLHERADRASVITPEIAHLDAVESALHEAEAAADHAQRVAACTRDIEESVTASARLNATADGLIADLDPLRDMLFDWDMLDEEPAGVGRARMLTAKLSAAAPLTIARVKERDDLRALTRLAEETQRARDDATSRTNKRAELDARLAAITAGADLEATVVALEKEERDLREETTRLDEEYKRLRVEHTRYDTLLKRWESAEPDLPCPTCGREFNEDDAETMFGSLRRSIATCVTEGKEVSRRLEEARTAGRVLSNRLQQEHERLKQAQTFLAQRERAIHEEHDAARRADEATEKLTHALNAASRRNPPTEKDIRALESEIGLLERAANAVPQASRLVTQIEEIEGRLTTQREMLIALGPAAYDPTAHDALRKEHVRLLTLQAEAANIADELRALPAEERRLTTAEAQIVAASASADQAKALQAELGFDSERLIAAEAAVTTAADAANAVQDHLAATRIALAHAQHTVERIAAEQTRLAVLKTEVDRLAASVERYDLMDRGFTDFSIALAARIQPRLGEYASDLIERMSNGRYHKMDFDTNYAPALYDGDLEKFPVEKFSGGERDIAALAARIALSQLLAARGGHTIGFMVLDEVFGSLDNERRTLVLDALAAMRDVVPQLFIISHVDDVRLSPVMDEVWTVATQPDGTSAVLRQDASDVLLGASIAAM